MSGSVLMVQNWKGTTRSKVMSEAEGTDFLTECLEEPLYSLRFRVSTHLASLGVFLFC